MKKLVYLLFSLCTLWGITGCSDDEEVRNWKDEPIKGVDEIVEEKTDKYHVTYQYKEDVIVLSPSRQIFLEKVESDTILYFSKDTPEEILPDVGEVITSSQSEKLPYGLGNIVLSKTQEGNLYKCVTTSTALDQIFSKLELSATFSLLDSLAGGFYDDDGNFIEAEWDKSETRSDDSPAMLKVSINKDVWNKKLSVSGALVLGMDPDLEIDLLHERYECSLDLSAKFTGDIKLNSMKISPKEPFTLFSKTISTIPIGFGPIVVHPFIKIEILVKPVGESSSLCVRFEKGERSKLGFRKNEKENGFFKEEIIKPFTTVSITDPDISVNGLVHMGVPVDFGLGLYTKRVALSIVPKLTLDLFASAELDEPNLFRNDTYLMYNSVAIVNAHFCADLFFKKLSYIPVTYAYGIGEKKYPLVPQLEENSFKVEKGLSDPLTFYASYNIKDKGLLTEIMDIYPAIHVYKGIDEIYIGKKNQPIYKGSYVFPLTGLDKDTHYTAKPAIIIQGRVYDEDGVPFSAITPTAAITDIVQTGADYAPDAFYQEGKYWDYEFKFYINVHLVGSQYCKSWGIYDPNSIDVYNPCELKDGRQTQYWTAWANTSSAKYSKRPYVVLPDNKIVYYEENSHTLYYGNEGFRSSPTEFNQGNMVFRLDSVKVEYNK